MTTLQQYLLINTLAATAYGEGVYNCDDYNNVTNCVSGTATGTGTGGQLAATGADVFLIGGIALAVLIAGIALLVKRLRRQPVTQK